MKNLNNKNAVITGGSDGIGLGIAKAFAREGANLLLIGKDPEKLQKAQQALLNEFGVQVHTLSADLSKTETVAEVVKDIEQLLSTVDILVNNAGLGKFIPFEQVDSTLYDAHFNLNVKAPYFLTQGLLPALVKSKGNVINISSYFAHRMLPNRATTVYSATKGAIISMNKALAKELGYSGITVNTVAPGGVDTDMLKDLPKESIDEYCSEFPLQRLAKPEEIANAVKFLISKEASYITGHVLNINGGAFI